MMGMSTLRRMLLPALCLTGLLVSVGCQQAPQASQMDLGPQRDADGYPRSVVMDAPVVQMLAGRRPMDGGLPWYADRNDLTPAAAAGYRLPTVQSSVTITRDRQYSNNGQVYDQYDSTSYQREYREIVR
jgi:hypothetical protein